MLRSILVKLWTEKLLLLLVGAAETFQFDVNSKCPRQHSKLRFPAHSASTEQEGKLNNSISKKSNNLANSNWKIHLTSNLESWKKTRKLDLNSGEIDFLDSFLSHQNRNFTLLLFNFIFSSFQQKIKHERLVDSLYLQKGKAKSTDRKFLVKTSTTHSFSVCENLLE